MNRQALKRLASTVARALPRAVPPGVEAWGLSRARDGGLSAGGVPLAGLVERYGSPLYVVDEARLADHVARFRAVPPGATAGCEVYYSYKTNPVPGVLSRLHALGVGAEVASPYELWLAFELGVEPAAIIYNGPAKSPESLADAVERGVGLINLNGPEELELVVSAARAARRRQRIGVRVVAPGARGGQFGASIASGAALELYRQALRHPELRVVGLHAHVNGEIATRAELDAHVEPLLAFSERLRGELGLTLEVLDVGGNLACPTVARLSDVDRRLAVTLGREPAPRPREGVLSIDAYVARLVELVEAHAARTQSPRPRIAVEPGRAMTGDAQHLLTRVVAVREPDAAGLTWVILDAGIHVAEPVPNEWHRVVPLRARRAPSRTYRLVGPSCTLGDLLYPAVELPELARGDVLAILDAGAYFVPLSTCFCFPRPAIVSVRDGRDTLLRRAETYDDLVLRDRVEPPPRVRISS